MVKTLTIRDEVYAKLLSRKANDESFSELFEKLLEGSVTNPIDILAKLRSSLELKGDIKESMLSEIGAK